MKYTFFICSLLVVLGLVPQVSLAESASATPSTTEAVTEIPTTPEVRTIRTERRINLTAAAQTRLTNLAANVSNRLDAYIRRISNVTDRLESRAAKMEVEGLDVTAAKSKIVEAREKLELARTTLGTIDTAVYDFVHSENPRTYWQTVKTTYITARDAIKGAHRATVEALLLLKTATTPAPTATTTETVIDNVE